MSILKRLVDGDWDDDFLVVRPGQCIAPRNDEQILSAE